MRHIHCEGDLCPEKFFFLWFTYVFTFRSIILLPFFQFKYDRKHFKTNKVKKTFHCGSQSVGNRTWRSPSGLGCGVNRAKNSGFEPDRLTHHVHAVHVFAFLMNAWQYDACINIWTLSQQLLTDSLSVAFHLTFQIICQCRVFALIAAMETFFMPWQTET